METMKPMFGEAPKITRRAVLTGAALAGIAAVGEAAGAQAAVRPPSATSAGAAFSYIAENKRAGVRSSQLPGPWRTGPAIEGFIGQHASTAARRIVDVYVSSATPRIKIKAYRIGHYNGSGQRLVWSSASLSAGRQNRATFDAKTRMISCKWKVTTKVNTTGWPEGFYYILLDGGSGHIQMIPFVVESASFKKKTVIVLNDLTMQAYNKWGGYSLYTGADNKYASRSLKVSFDRPYYNFSEMDLRNSPLVRAAEAIPAGPVALAYTTEARIAASPKMLEGAAAILFTGHSEYWTGPLRSGIEAARDTGSNVAFFGANNVYWRSRTEASPLGAGRVLVCYREPKQDPLANSKPAQVTTRWRDDPAANPESSLTGSMFCNLGASGTFTVTDPAFFAFAGTGAKAGAAYPGLVGGEIDHVFAGPGLPKNLRVFARSPAKGNYNPNDWADSTVYTAASGAGVISIGSMNWLQAQADPKVPATARAFGRKVTQNIVSQLALGPLGRHYVPVPNAAPSRVSPSSVQSREPVVL